MLKFKLDYGELWVGYHDELGIIVFDPKYDPGRHHRKDGSIYLSRSYSNSRVYQKRAYARAHLIDTGEYALRSNKTNQQVFEEFRNAAVNYAASHKDLPQAVILHPGYGTRAYDSSSHEYNTNIFPNPDWPE